MKVTISPAVSGEFVADGARRPAVADLLQVAEQGENRRCMRASRTKNHVPVTSNCPRAASGGFHPLLTHEDQTRPPETALTNQLRTRADREHRNMPEDASSCEVRPALLGASFAGRAESARLPLGPRRRHAGPPSGD